ncbi:hypothetical protein CALCODRAFT_497398 [Calocera cornea HHB12733]|uniref:Protein kinase domain-containing protein n=1 Tax=Calocera cornea HHB12733 TaxID=1353952 RepID=A0A165FB17_9BASI|nr:hypothetical protein CALCODRAFT_497398 [Calocera cornea HHB12733]
MDAVRVRDSAQVVLKLWSDDPHEVAELSILRYFSDPSTANHPSNHSVPLLEAFPVEGYADVFDETLVEPLLRDCRQPSWTIAAEIVSFLLQVLEGLEYMHSQNVAHGDIHLGNILLDARAMFPNGFHGPFNFQPDQRLPERGIKRLTRLQAPVKYCYIDFGSGFMFLSFEARKGARFNAAALIPPEVLANREAPFDPFKGDVWALGFSVVEQLRYRSGLDFLEPAFLTMMEDDPNNRPTPKDAMS